jgi:asparagine synthase (glutamine-hydrolysing)
MLSAMHQEKFYCSGTHHCPELGVYAGWIAHEDAVAAAQPLHGESAERWLLLSGECLADEGPGSAESNPRQLDASRILQCYEEQDVSFLARLNGMFSGLLFDRRRRKVLLFNDRFGLERLYYCEKNETVIFASEAKALLRVLPETRALDDEAVMQFLAYGCTMRERSLFRNVRVLPGASLWSITDGCIASRTRYFLPEQWECQPALGETTFQSEFEEVFRNALPAYLASASRTGVSVTGGLDTRMIMACLPGSGQRPVCYTFAGMQGDTLDVRLGRQVAHACGLQHYTLRIGRDFLTDFGQWVDRTVNVTDGCAGAVAAHEIYLTALARRLAPVRVTGNYGSEILRGVSTFKPIDLHRGFLEPEFHAGVRAQQQLTAGPVHPVTHAAFREIPWRLFGTLSAARSQVIFRTPYLHNSLVRLAYRAPARARASARAAILLVQRTNPALTDIPTDRGLLLRPRRAAELLTRLHRELTFKLDYLDKEGMPNWLSPFGAMTAALGGVGLLGLHKFLPYRIWFRNSLAGYVHEVLTDARTRRMPYWNGHDLHRLAADHRAGRRNNLNEIHALLTLEAVDRVLIRAVPRTQST